MKIKTIIFTLIFLSPLSYTIAQGNILALKEKNGFKKFSFGDNYSTYSHQLDFQSKWKGLTDERTFYTYTANKPSAVFYQTWDKLHLGFSGNTLTKIIVQYNQLYKQDLQKILIGLRQQFGKETSYSANIVAYTHTWYDKDISVGMTLHYDNSEKYPAGIYIEIYDDNLHYNSIYDADGKF
ncbi:hypothetical protein H0I29_00645 [Polaribacter sp. R2A056_3_33]|uniref:hypothetical protein n=1 Tax=unclassified Polaribacter TaxID=196858 RepID=UPI001C4ECB51|nr:MULTISPECIES: hypothetical protein [unclassified Polaribacter]QXP62745.1 hypothetical protein H0I27_12830 [Polaribacter sp. HaHaR_3_91]QXP70650.1 hypothetical protein H0I29_00645 [Polaribacter sp. R2A056_3_33]